MRSASFSVTIENLLLVTLFAQHVVDAIPVDRRTFANVTARPRIVSRAEWQARNRLGEAQLKVSPVPYVVVHHGGMRDYCYDQERCSAIVRSYQNLHIDERGWCDIGYNFVIGEDGNAYEGRGWSLVGAHAPGYNIQSVGICIIGDFTDFLPNKAALETLKSLIAYGVDTGKIVKNYKLIGHRQARDTECPGQKLFEYLTKVPHWTSHPTPLYSNSTFANDKSIRPRNDDDWNL